MDGRRLKRVRMFCSDIDGTLAGNAASEARFRDAWLDLPEDNRPLLVVNSGRLIDDQRRFIATTFLPKPDLYIGGVGTMLHHETDPSCADLYARSLGSGFDRDQVAKLLSGISSLTIQPDEFQHAQKSSWYFPDADAAMLSDIEDRLTGSGLAARVVYSSNRDLDILPAGTDKGAALSWLCRHTGLSHEEVVVAGDTNNDRSMFELPGIRGIVVNNALPELLAVALDQPAIYTALAPMADGVVEGLKHWGVLDDV